MLTNQFPFEKCDQTGSHNIACASSELTVGC